MPFLVKEAVVMIPASTGHITKETRVQMTGWMTPKKPIFQMMLGTNDTRGLWVSKSNTTKEMVWNTRLNMGTRTGPDKARHKLP